MSVLVTGANGFIGAHLVRALLARGERVVALDIVPQPPGLAGVQDRLCWVQTDITDGESLRAIFQTERPRAAINLASLLPPQTEHDPTKALRINLMSLDSLFRTARETGVHRVVWMSSMAVYGSAERYPEQPVDENAPTWPTTLYGAIKVMAESLAKHYAREYQLDTIGLRANLVYGPGRVRGLGEYKTWSRDLFECAVRGEPVVVPYGDQPLDWIYVVDVVRAIERALDVDRPAHQIFNVLGDRRPVRDAVAEVRRRVPGARIEVTPGLLPRDKHPPAFDGRRARDELGYTPGYSLEEGVAAYLHALQDEEER